jgi:BirA family biotin operon repressor/biotin-[acetyl-CoA-carboxylase] ligase
MRSNISTKAEIEFAGRLHLPQCQSTNDEMQAVLAQKSGKLPEGFLISTDFQSAGRGQRGNHWESAPGKNLLFTILLRPDFLEPRLAFRLTATLATGLTRALEDEFPGLKLKWPNDLMYGNQKTGGILVETLISGQGIDRALCGIGINVNQIDLPDGYFSLAGMAGKTLDRERLLKTIYTGILREYDALREGKWPQIRSAYLNRLFRLAEPAWYRLPDGSRFHALLKGISEEGALILLGKEGEMQFRFKEVQFEL